MARTPLGDVVPSAAGGRSIHVLVVDDDEARAGRTAQALASELPDAATTTLTDPAAAVETLRDGSFDCVVSEYDLPAVDGVELLERVREAGFDLPFVLFTATGSEAVASRAVSAGVDGYLRRDESDQYSVLAEHVERLAADYWADQQVRRGFRALESAEEGIGIVDDDGVYQYVNEAYAAVYDREPADLVGEHWQMLYPDAEAKRFREEILPELEASGSWRGVSTGLTADGEPVPERLVLKRLADGGHVCIVQQSGQEPNPTAELGWKTRAMDEAPVGIVFSDPNAEDNPLVYVNDRFVEMTGYERAEAVGQNCRFLQGENTREEPVARMREAVENEASVTVELRNYRADGTEFWNRVTFAPIFDDDGEVALFVGFQEDVTESHAREEQLRASTNRLEALFELSPDLIFVHDAEGTILDVNREVREELGYEAAEIVGEPVWKFDDTAEPEHALSFWEELPMNTPRRFEGRLVRADGSTLPVEVHLIRLDLEGEDRFVAIDRDISEQKEREAELLRHNERLTEFSNVVSHDLRNPLQVAQGRLGLLEEEVESEHTEDLGNALDRMEALIDDLLTLAREGRDAMEFEPVDVASVAHDAWETVETEAASLTVDVALRVDADRDQLQQLFENLFRNAVEHAGPDVTVRVGQTPAGFYVADDGPGIPEPERGDVFDPGYSTGDGGTGFGLNIVQNVADAHGWTVSVTESADGGARFEVAGVHDD